MGHTMFFQSTFNNRKGHTTIVKDLSVKYEIDEQELEKALNRLKNKDSLLFTMSGKMGAGKDTIGDLISNELDIKGYSLINTSFGYLIRKEVTNVVEEYNTVENKETYALEINVDKKVLDKLSFLLENCTAFDRTDEARLALQIWGTDIRRNQQDNYWIVQMSRFVIQAVNKGYSVNITDARFPNETRLVEELSGKVIRLDVPENIRVERVEKRDNIKVNPESLIHISELALDDYKFDRVFDGTKRPKRLMKEGLKYILEE